MTVKAMSVPEYVPSSVDRSLPVNMSIVPVSMKKNRQQMTENAAAMR